MSQMLFYTTKQGNSTQEWLGLHRMCPACDGLKPKAGFMMYGGQETCSECIEDDKEEKATQ
jgi:uncharacterized protein (DUF983 family)